MLLTGRTALISGGGSGIGAATATLLAAQGARVVVADRTVKAATPVAASIGGDAGAAALDVRDTGALRTGVADIAGRVGRIDILVAAAGVFSLQPFAEVTEAEYDRTFAVNCKGMFFLLQAVAEVMVRQGGGTVVTVASQAGRRGEPLSSVYAATKAAVISFTRSAALDLIRAGIRVNAVAPGIVRTPMWDQVDGAYAAHLGLPPGAYTDRVRQAVPVGRLADPVEVAQVIAFLAGPHSSYVIGETVDVTGADPAS
ncbi:SDR family oxidoreductase [Nakamurella endophytica]|uniref:Sorbitol dehydrogenase n=1 Tax=Nakamurella endophytica TaxID=1748367 RepID=A0A917WJM0_9ACTN|nr:SDR family oxidoreductase [Nakamurella endophytica]GGM10877.1 sorbitol dehydrogenase [Nakamurella endophytica]